MSYHQSGNTYPSTIWNQSGLVAVGLAQFSAWLQGSHVHNLYHDRQKLDSVVGEYAQDRKWACVT